MGAILALLVLVLALLVSQWFVCQCTRAASQPEDEAREVGADDNQTDADQDQDDDTTFNQRHPNRIEYDNRQIYRTSNNYGPYKLREAQQEAARAATSDARRPPRQSRVGRE